MIVTVIVGLLTASVRMAATAPDFKGVAGALGSCRPLPVTIQHHYRMAAKVRPLLFWIGRDNVGEADAVWRRGEDGLGYELLIGSDPALAPMKINRWGYIAEQIQGPDACLIGVMKQSDEESIEEARSSVAREGQDGRYVFKAIRAVATPDEARAGVTTVNVSRDLTLHDLPALLDIVTSESRGTRMRSVSLPSGTRPGFLVALAEIIHQNAEAHRQLASAASRSAGPVTFVYNGTLHDLMLRRSEALREWTAGTRRSTNVVRADFESRNRETGEKTTFELVYGTDGPLAEIPVHATYQPRWWFQVELVLDDTGAF
ncbi:MAG: hypothetical protein HY047_14935 [Acidobacteria bacterium]|nr:hypothetical protein [Acidobacteriota bacterium]